MNAPRPSRLLKRVLTLTSLMILVSLASPGRLLSQKDQAERNDCAITEILKSTKTVPVIYNEEALRKKIEGKVILCLTVNERGKVTHVAPISGPQELLISSMDIARRWEFEPPQKAPARTTLELGYNLTGSCPEGKGSDQGDIVTTIVPTEEHADNLKILGKVCQPWPPYPEAARAERRRGQLYLSILVNPDGTVSDVQVIRPLDELLDKPAVDTVRTWTFKVSPTGKATRFSVTLSFRIPCLDVDKK